MVREAGAQRVGYCAAELSGKWSTSTRATFSSVRGLARNPATGKSWRRARSRGVDGGGEHEDHALLLGRGQLLVGFEERKPVHDGHVEVEEDEGRATGRGRPAVGVQYSNTLTRPLRAVST